LSVQGWCGCLELSDHDIEREKFSHVFKRLEYFINVNLKSIHTLNENEFFTNKNFSSQDVFLALKTIKNDQTSIIAKDYQPSQHRKNLRTLEKDLLTLHQLFSSLPQKNDLTSEQVEKVLSYACTLLWIIYAFKR